MALASEQFEENEKTSEEPKASNESCDVIRNKIDRFLKDENFKKTLDKEAFQGYQDVVDKKGRIDPNDLENLQKFYKYMKEGWEDDIQPVLDRMDDHIDHTIRDKVITEADRGFYDELMDEHVLTGNQNVDKGAVEKAEKELLDSLEKRRNERKEYDDLMKSGLVEDGTLMINENEEKEIPNEQGYLKMSVKERRKFLKEIRELLPKVKKYYEGKEKIKSEQLKEEYKILLKGAKKEGIIGDEVIDRFMKWLEGQDNTAKEYAIKQFFKEMVRYRDLWKDIKKTLKGTSSLADMECLRDKKGHSELCEAFEEKIVKEYEKKQIKDFEKKPRLISRHTMQDNLKAIDAASLEKKKEYLEDYDQEMQHYKELRSDINAIKNKDIQKTLNEMYDGDQYGYKEIRAKYNRLTGQGLGETKDSTKRKSDPLSEVTNVTAKSGIIQAVKLLGKRGGKEKKRKFGEMLERMIVGEQSDKFDKNNFQSQLQETRKKNQLKKQPKVHLESDRAENMEKPYTEQRVEQPIDQNTGRNDNVISFQDRLKKERAMRSKEEDVIDRNVTEEEMDIAEKKEGARVIKDEGFKQVEIDSGKGQNERITLVEINRKKGLERLDIENQKREFRNRQDGGRDSLTCAIHAEDGRLVRLELKEIRAAIKYIKEDGTNSDLEEEQIKKAA